MTEELMDWFLKVRDKELPGWKVELWDITHGECLGDEFKIIHMPKKYELEGVSEQWVKSYFLHEVAHGLIGAGTRESVLHLDKWKKTYRYLLKKYNVKLEVI
jgi:hypothetical protein